MKEHLRKIQRMGIYCIGRPLEFFTCLMLAPKLRNYKKLRRPSRRFLIFYDQDNVFKVVKFSDAYGLKLLLSLLDTQEYDRYRRTLGSLGSLEFLNRHIAGLTGIYRTGSYSSPYINGYNLQLLAAGQKGPDARGLSIGAETRSDIKGAVSELLEALRNYDRKHGFLIGDWHLSNLLYDPKAKRVVNVDLEGFYTYNINTKFNLYKIFENDLKWVEEQLKDFCGRI